MEPGRLVDWAIAICIIALMASCTIESVCKDLRKAGIVEEKK